MRDSFPTRRGVLAAAGTALLAGCNELDWSTDGSRETIPSTQLPDVPRDGDADPIVVDDVPVRIERTRLAQTTQHAGNMVERLPVPFGPTDVPNGYVRQRLLDAVADATKHVEDARTAQTRLSAFQSLREARARARYAAAGAAFADGETTETAIEADYWAAVSDARSVRTAHEYLGVDPIEAALVHARIEHNLESVLADRRPTTGGNTEALLTVAEWGEHAESAQASVDDSRYLYDRFRSSLPADAGSLEGTLTNASDALSAELRNRRDDLPAEPTEGDRESVWRLRYRLWDAADGSVERVTRADGPASAVLAATAGLTDHLAYDRVQAQIDEGERFRIETAEDVRTARSRAHDAIRAALEESPRTDLARPVLADTAASVAFADGELSRLDGNVPLSRLDDPVRRYTIATARAHSVPTACQHVLDALNR